MFCAGIPISEPTQQQHAKQTGNGSGKAVYEVDKEESSGAEEDEGEEASKFEAVLVSGNRAGKECGCKIHKNKEITIVIVV
jgi:hypothetical protein